MPESKFEAVAGEIATAEGQFVLLATLQTAFHFWWFVFLLAFAGGLIGWLAHMAQPPLYEAVAHFSTSIDYVRTGPLTQFEEDTAINAVANVINSNAVVQMVVDRAAAEGIRTSIGDLRTATILERRLSVWDVRVRNTDARVAERLANLWVEQGQTALLAAYQHALQADHWNLYLLSLENCLSKAAASEPASGQCSKTRFVEIQEDLQAAGKMYYQERLASLDLFSGLTIGSIDKAVGAGGPVLYGRNQMVLAGCLIGFLLGIALIQMGFPARLLTRRSGRKPGRS